MNAANEADTASHPEGEVLTDQAMSCRPISKGVIMSIDQNEPPLFDIDETHEPDTGDEGDSRGGSLTLEGVQIPFDILEFGNGQLPDSVLQPIGVARHRLHASAAAAFGQLRSLAAAAGIDLTCTDSYRTLEQQKQLKQAKPNWSATPGKSVHGWGFAVDVSIGTPPKSFGASVLQWLKDNGPPNGWFLGRPKDEPWHWVYRGAGAAPAAATPQAAATSQAEVAPAPQGDAALTSNAEVRMGASGTAVKILRGLLNIAPGDSFDQDTDAAVRAFQTANGLTVDGRCGPKTWAKLRSVTAPADRPDLALNSTGDAVMWVQRRLARTLDGQFGPRTEGSVKAFQQASGLAATGIVDAGTWNALTT
jgi:D-alanyl-D-alanine carboxypeptidase/Putative peptidoglycan binding domain